jgi:predicted amidophosphoribosyltransferase
MNNKLDEERRNKFLANVREAKSGISQKYTFEMTKLCPDCGTKMKYIYGEMFECPTCGKKQLSDFGLVREYLDSHGPQPAIIISEATGVSVDVIDHFLRQGRVEIPDGSGVYIKCQSCGADIRYGRYCPECMAKMSKSWAKLFLLLIWERDLQRKLICQVRCIS